MMMDGNYGQQPHHYFNGEEDSEGPKKVEVDAEFLEEIRNQCRIAIETSDRFESATPHVVFGGIYTKNSEKGQILGKLLSRVRGNVRENWFDNDAIRAANANDNSWYSAPAGVDSDPKIVASKIGIVVMQIGGGYEGSLGDMAFWRAEGALQMWEDIKLTGSQVGGTAGSNNIIEAELGSVTGALSVGMKF